MSDWPETERQRAEIRLLHAVSVFKRTNTEAALRREMVSAANEVIRCALHFADAVEAERKQEPAEPAEEPREARER